jgi:photosystem II stability/assembly factor-like uncharacterized protein
MKRISGLITSLLPFLIIGALLYAAFFIKPTAAGASLSPPPIQARDAFYGIAAPAENIVWAVGRNAKIVRSEDRGKTWAVQRAPREVNLQSIVAWDTQRAIAVGNVGTVIRTEDGGRIWTPVAGLPEQVASAKFMRARSIGDGAALVVGEFGTVLMTRDSGNSWTSVGKKEDVAWNDVAIAGDTWIVAGEFGRIQRSRDAGATWEAIASPVKSSLNAIAFRDQQTGIAAGLDGVLLASSDGGASWKQIESSTKVHLFDIRPSATGWLAAADQGLLLRSTDGGPWSAVRLIDRDYSWYSSIEPAGDQWLIAGAGFGSVNKNNQFKSFK